MIFENRPNARDRGLGPVLRQLNDSIVRRRSPFTDQPLQILEFFEHFDADDLIHLSAVSIAFNAFANHDEIWQTLALSIDSLRDNFKFHKNWKSTVLNHLYPSKFPSFPSEAPLALTDFYSERLYQRHLVNCIPIKPKWTRGHTIPEVKHEDMSPERFASEFEAPNKPVIIKKAVTHWPAVKDKLWTRESLIERCKDTLFKAGPVDITMANYFDYLDQISQQDDNPLFIFDQAFADNLNLTMGKEYVVPEYFPDDLFGLLDNRPNYRWLLLGGKRSGSKWHIDPNATSAWNAVVSGRKRWWMMPPKHVPPGVQPSENFAEVTQPLSLFEWLSEFYDKAKETGELLEGTCGPGDLIFVPRGWWHAVLNLDDDTIAVTQNYVNRHSLTTVRRFLRFRADQVSGVHCDRRLSLWKEFDEALKKNGVLDKDSGPVELPMLMRGEVRHYKREVDTDVESEGDDGEVKEEKKAEVASLWDSVISNSGNKRIRLGDGA